MIKLLYIVSHLKRCGPNNQLYNLLSNFDKEELHVCLLTLSPETQDSLWNKFEALDIELHALNLSRFEAVFAAPGKIKKQIQRFQPDIIHTQDLRPDLISGFLLKKHLRVATLRNFPFEDYVNNYGMIKGKIIALLHLRALKKTANVYANSEATAQRLNDLGYTFLNFINNGVETDVFKPTSAATVEKLKIKLGLPINGKIILSVGHLSPGKNPEELLKAFETMTPKEELHLLMLGDGILMQQLRDKYTNSNIHFLGRKSDVKNFYKIADIFISSSLSEGLPNTVLEALSTGTPCILSDIPPHKMIASYYSEGVSVYKSGNTASLQKRIIEQTEKKNNFTTFIRETTIEKFAAKNMSKKYVEQYRRLIQK